MSVQQKFHTGRRAILFAGTGAGLIAAYFMLRGLPWQSDGQLHTVMEVAATLLAAFIGVLALIRYYSHGTNAVLIIGAGFLGTAFLDGFHGLATSAYFEPFMPSDRPSLLPWSWFASRFFLSLILFVSWLVYLREQNLGDDGKIPAKPVYLFSAAFTLACFLFFAFAPLPPAYYPTLLFPRPEEFLPAFFFLLALIGYLHRGDWRYRTPVTWFILGLIANVVAQAIYMPSSERLFDASFDAAHLLKIAGYLCALIGLLVSQYEVFKGAESQERRNRAILETIPEGIMTVDASGAIRSVNPGAARMFGYDPEQAVGKPFDALVAHSESASNGRDFAILAKSKNGKASERKAVGFRQDGQSFPLAITVGEFRFENDINYVVAIRDITEQQKADRVKDEFVSTVSHELRTPLTSIVGSLGIIRSGSAGALPEKASSMIDIAHNNSNRLVRLINDMLDIEKIQSGNMTFRMASLDIQSLIAKTISEAKGFADQFGVGIALRRTPGAIRVVGDSDRLAQVLTNLLSNAAKFSPENGEIDVSIHRIDRKVLVTVSDAGPGIPVEFHERIFGRFAQADASDSRQKGGTGLGLNICKAIIERHGGEIGFTTSQDSGTTFHFKLDILPDTLSDALSLNGSDAKRNILICEDEPEIATILATILHAGGYGTEIATGAEDAYEKLSSGNHSAMTLDLKLPDGNGISLIRRIRANRALGDLPIVVVAADATDSAYELNGDAVSVIDWLDKPIDSARLLSALQRTFNANQNGRPRILHVEDDPNILSIVAALVDDRAVIYGADSIGAAKQLLAKYDFDAAILDLMLPDGSGEELLTALRRSDGTPVDTIVFSAREISEGAAADNIRSALLKSRATNNELLATIMGLLENAKSGVAPAEGPA